MCCSWLKILLFPHRVPTYGDKTISVNPIFLIFGIITYFADVFSDIFLAVQYFNQRDEFFFIMTICFVVLPGVTMSAFSVYMYWRIYNPKDVSKLKLFIRAIFLISCMDPILRNIQALIYYFRSVSSKNAIEKKQWAVKMLLENIHGTYLRTYEAFTECGPQLILQVYIFSRTETFDIFSITEILRIISMFTSLISMTNAITTYERVEREGDTDLEELSCSASCTMFVGRFFELVSRVIALSYFASGCTLYFWIVCAAHLLLMFLWYRLYVTWYCFYFDSAALNYILQLVVAVIYIFCYVTIIEGPSQRHYVFFYSLMFMENTSLLLAWYWNVPRRFKLLPVFIIHYVAFALSIALLIVFYISFFPKSKKDSRAPSFSRYRVKRDVTTDEDDNDDVKDDTVEVQLDEEAEKDTAGSTRINVQNGGLTRNFTIKYKKNNDEINDETGVVLETRLGDKTIKNIIEKFENNEVRKKTIRGYVPRKPLFARGWVIFSDRAHESNEKI